MPYATREAARQAERRYEARKAEEANRRGLTKRDGTPYRSRRRLGDRHEDNRARMAAERTRQRLEATFVGVDGEGWTDPETGRHHYMLLCAGDRAGVRSLWTGEPLSSEECLAFLSHLPNKHGQYFVSFFFDYDVTMILRDLVDEVPDVARMLVSKEREFGTFVTWNGFQIDYVPKKHLRVAEIGGPLVTIHDTRAFFQCAFHKAITDLEIGTERERDLIGSMKAERANFDAGKIAEIRYYCGLECCLLAEMIGKLRDRFADVEMSAFPYEGPGPVAGRALTKYLGRGTLPPEDVLPPRVLDFAKRAYYGGRFETTAVGNVSLPVHGYDIHSAYPDAMRRLPCLVHGRWHEGADEPLYVAHVRWQMPDWPNYRTDADGASELPWRVMGPLPHRVKNTGAILYPVGGEGWYWSPEIPPYAEIVEAWSYESRCACEPFDWVPDLYEQRAAMEAERKGSGIALKLTLNSLYGKLAQRIGRAPHYNPVWAGLITAFTRAKVYQVYLDHPLSVVMFATDAVFLTEPAPELPISPALGDWEAENDGEPYEEFCIFRPGIYFDSGVAKFKTRGIPKKEFSERADEFYLAATGWLPPHEPSVTLNRENHLSLRQGLAWSTGGDGRINRQSEWLGRIGDWIPSPRVMSPRPMPKRLDVPAVLDGLGPTSYTAPIPRLSVPTHPYDHEAEQPWEESADDADFHDDGMYDGDIG